MGNKVIKNHEIVSEFLKFPPFNDDLAYCQEYDSFYLWENNHYRFLKINSVHDIIHNFMINRYPEIQTTEYLVRDLIYQIKRMLPDNRKFDNYATEYLAFNDCYFNTNTFDPSPTVKDKLVVYNLPYPYQEIQNFDTPIFYKYLQTTIIKEGTREADNDLISLVQEMFGFYLMDNLKATGAFFMIGEGSNGKSVMINILYNMIGRDFCSSMSIQTLTTNNFAVADLIGKKINISNEEESKYMKGDVFKALITGDPVSADRKFQSRINFKPRTKYLFASNEMPTFETLNYGLKRRIKIIPFYRRFSDKEADKNLSDKLVKELPGIVAWAIAGAKRLVENNYVFSEPKATQKELEEFESEISSSLRFVKDNYVVDDSGFIENVELYDHYRNWCDGNGKKSVNSIRFHKELLRMSDIKSIRGYDKYNQRKHGKNLSLKMEEQKNEKDQTFLSEL